MIDVRLLRQDPDFVKTAMARRTKPHLLDELEQALQLDFRLREITSERDAIRAKVNALSAEVATMRRNNEDVGVESLIASSKELSTTEKKLASEFEEVSTSLRGMLLSIPNLPHPEVVFGNSDQDNKVVKGPIQMPAKFEEHQRVPHWQTGKDLNILDNERATKISGAMFTMQKGLGATLARALCQYALDKNSDAFEEIRPPSLVLTSTLTSTGQLPKFADDAFSIQRDDLWCIPTAEVPLTSLHASEILDGQDLPLRYMAHTTCFRREAGSAGRDTRGMLRSHEFDKVEILAVTTAEQAPAMLIELVSRVESTISSLGLPYRVLEICTGDLGQSHHRSFDIEVYSPGCDLWLEVSSISWFSDYQARRAEIRYRTPGVKGSEIAHTLNASAMAVPRVWAAILENFRQPDGSVVIPEVLHPYMRGTKVIASQ